MDKIKRWEPNAHGGGTHPHNAGNYVEWFDHKRAIGDLQSELATLRQQLVSAEQMRDSFMYLTKQLSDLCIVHIKRCDKAEQQLVDSQKDGEISAAVQRACGELPDWYEIEIRLEKGAGVVCLVSPEGEQDREWLGDTLADQVNNAISFAIDDAMQKD